MTTSPRPLTDKAAASVILRLALAAIVRAEKASPAPLTLGAAYYRMIAALDSAAEAVRAPVPTHERWLVREGRHQAEGHVVLTAMPRDRAYGSGHLRLALLRAYQAESLGA